MRLCHQVDAAAHILHRRIRLEAYIGREAFLGFLGGHAIREGNEYVRTPAHTVFHQEDFPFALFLKAKRCFQNFGGMALLVEVEHEPRKGFQGIGDGAMMVLEQPTVGCPYGEAAFQLFVTSFDEPAELGKRRFSPCFLPLLAGNGKNRCTMPLAHAGKGVYSLHAASFLAKRRAAKRRSRASVRRFSPVRLRNQALM